MITSELVSFIELCLIGTFTTRGCYFSWRAFQDDNIGKWITVSEALASGCWVLFGVDIALSKYLNDPTAWELTAIFLFAFMLKALSCILKSEKGYKPLYRLYRTYKLR